MTLLAQARVQQETSVTLQRDWVDATMAGKRAISHLQLHSKNEMGVCDTCTDSFDICAHAM